ncbi:MAG: geranylgeranyl reductase family protein [Flavobacteriales bacterium]|nr:geranylgeranyl reductase family protein [Flavobacteriales bacterium]
MIRVTPKIKYDCDVMIVGAGPAGSGLAFHLASKGIKVTVVESAVFPRDKICGDGVSPIALAELDKMGITHTKEFDQTNEINKVGLFLKDDKVFIDLSKPDHLPYHARIIPRIELDNWIYTAAKNAGATYIEGTSVTEYLSSENGVVVHLKSGENKSTLKTKLLVGADGGNSTIARQLHGRKPNDEFQLLGLRAYYDNVNGPNDRVDIYFNEDGFPGIFWMFPVGEKGANVGIAMISKTFPSKPDHVKKILLAHIENNKDIKERIGEGELSDKIRGWPITFFNPKQKLSDNRIILIGEAAGLINPLSGDGIQYALLSARWASETIEECVKENRFSAQDLNKFTLKVKEEVAYDFSLSNLLVQFPRNKTFTKMWIKILTVMIAKAKEDKEYADTIAGIFEGTYPSYHALNLSFILKTLKQGGVELSNSFQEHLTDPQKSITTGAEMMELFTKIMSEVKDNPKQHLKWIADTVLKTGTVAKHVVKTVDLESLSGVFRTEK